MKKVLVIAAAALLAAASASAQAPQAPEHQLSLTDEEIGVVWSALRQRSWDEVNKLMLKIQGQLITEQQRQSEAQHRAQEAEIDRRVKEAVKPPDKPAEPTSPEESSK